MSGARLVLLMDGARDTLREHPGAMYRGLALAELEAMAREPACCPKDGAPCAIFSTYCVGARRFVSHRALLAYVADREREASPHPSKTARGKGTKRATSNGSRA